MHEIGHTLGLGHEHARADRDKYIKINWGNIPKDMQFAFEKESESAAGGRSPKAARARR